MLISTIFMWVAIALGFVVALPCLWLIGLALWPKASAKRAEMAALGIGKSILLGLIPLLVTIAIASKLGKGGIVAVLPVAGLMLWGFASADGLAIFVGREVWPHLGELQPWKQTLRGGLLLVGAALLPLVGWIFILPLLGVLGWGLSLRSLFAKDEGRVSSDCSIE